MTTEVSAHEGPRLTEKLCQRPCCPFREFHLAWIRIARQNHPSLRAMFAILHALGMFVADLFKSRSRLEAENLFLRHQLNIALRRVPPRLRLRGIDRALFTWMIKLWPSFLGAAQVVQPETILRWHRAGFKAYWRWKSRNPRVDPPLIDPTHGGVRPGSMASC